MQNSTPCRRPFMWQEFSTFWLMESPEVDQLLWWDPISHCLVPGVLLLLLSFRACPPGDAWWVLLNRKTKSRWASHVQEQRLEQSSWATRLSSLLLQYEIILWITKSLSSLLLQAGPPRSGTASSRHSSWEITDSQAITKYPSILHLPWALQTCLSPDSKIS